MELVLVLRRRQRPGVDLQQRLAQLLGGRAVVDALEGEHEPAVLPPGAGDGDRAALGRVGVEHCAGCEAVVGVVGADLHRHLALDPLRAADPTDDEQVVVVRTRRGPGSLDRVAGAAGGPGRRRCPATRATD